LGNIAIDKQKQDLPFLSEGKEYEFRKFHDELKKLGLLNSPNTQGKIVVIDQDITLKIMEWNFERFGITERVSLFQDGHFALEKIKDVLSDLTITSTDSVIQPISLLIVEINMPIINGLQICASVKALYDEKQSELEAISTAFTQQLGSSTSQTVKSEVKLVRPMIIYMSDIDYNQMQ